MKPRQLIPLFILVLILGGLVYYREQQQKPPRLEEQYQLTRLLPEGLQPSEIGRIEMYAGAKPNEKLELKREDDGWVVTSHFDAPVQSAKITKYLDTLTGLQGEFRATVSGDGLDEYDLSDAEGFHVIGYPPDSDSPLFHIVNGKSPDYGQAFARAEDSDDVYLMNVSLRREAGIYTVEMSDAPQPGSWLDKQITDLNSSDIKKIAMKYPDKELVLELRKKEPANDESAEGEASKDAKQQASEADEAGEASPKEEVVQWNWVVAKGGPNDEFHSNAAMNVARRASGLSASDIVDPSKTEKWGLDNPQYELTLTVEGKDEPIVLQAARPKDPNDRYRYFRVASSDRNLVYKVSGYDFEQIFPAGGEFFELPGVLVDASEVDAIEYTVNGEHVKLTRDGDTWNVADPKTAIALDTDAVDEIVRAVISWKATDYADTREGKGLDAPKDTLTFTGPNVKHTFALGAETPDEGRYASLDGRPQVLVMSERDVARIFVPYGKLFETKLFDVDRDNVTAVTVHNGDQTAQLTNTDDGWALKVNGETANANPNAADGLVSALIGLKAADFAFGDARVQGGVTGSATFTTEDGTEHQITIGKAQDGLNPVTKRGSADAYLVPTEDIGRVLVDFETLKAAAKQDTSAEAAAGTGPPETPETAEPEPAASNPQ